MEEEIELDFETEESEISPVVEESQTGPKLITNFEILQIIFSRKTAKILFEIIRSVFDRGNIRNPIEVIISRIEHCTNHT